MPSNDSLADGYSRRSPLASFSSLPATPASAAARSPAAAAAAASADLPFNTCCQYIYLRMYGVPAADL